jgi:hypothetical protein
MSDFPTVKSIAVTNAPGARSQTEAKLLEHVPDPEAALAQSGNRFCLATNAKTRLRGDHAQTKR